VLVQDHTQKRAIVKLVGFESPLDHPDMQSYSHGVGTPLVGTTIGDALTNTAARYPDGLALVVRHQGLRLNWSQLSGAVDRASKAFLALGIEKGDRVAIRATNCAEWVVTQLATARIGAILVNLNPVYRTSEVAHALRRSETQTLVLIRGFRDCDYVQTLSEIVPELHHATRGRLASAALPNLSTVSFVGADPPAELLGWNDFLALGDSGADAALAERRAMLSFDDAINIQFTSGTTGSPKGALLTHHNVLNNARFIGPFMRIGAEDRICIPVPFYHCFGMVIGNLVSVSTGAAKVAPAASFDPLATLAAVHDERCTALYGVPTMFIAELEQPEFDRFDLGSLRTGVMAGAPCPVELMKRVVSRMHCSEITICDGLAEASPVITQTRADDPVDVRVRSVGRALPNAEVKIVDPQTNHMVPVGTSGELCTRGYLVMKGYYKDPEATARAIDAGGWLHSGDLAAMDDRGYFNITGRLKELIIRGGENISPREIEEFLHTHPKLSAVQVIGVPDPKYGEQVMAWIRLKEDVPCTEEEIRDFCRGRIATYKIPRRVKFVTEFPMSVTGKVQKFRMRELAVQELGREDRAA
jgi:fatty-acyl-CoA synthase